MEISKLPFEKLFGFIAGIIPGAVAIFVYYVANPNGFAAFVENTSLTYSTKIGIALALAFVIGNSLNMFMGAIGAAIGGGFSGANSLKNPVWPNLPETAPWRDLKWRKLAKQYLGEHAPNDTRPMSDNMVQFHQQTFANLDGVQRQAAENQLKSSKLALASDDLDWSQWYFQIDRQRQAQTKFDPLEYVQGSLQGSLQTTAVYLIGSMIFVPNIRNWICISFSVGWLVIMVAKIHVDLKDGSNSWSTWSKQLDFLTAQTLGQTKKAAQESTVAPTDNQS
jgi:hypothetical protein